MNTSKQINIMVALVFIALLVTGIYVVWDPNRAEDARAIQQEHTLERAAYLYAQNCRVCHGDAGEGGAAANRLRLAPPLNRPDLRGVDPKTGEVVDAQRNQQFEFVFNTISCGRVGKAMPTWGEDNGGPLNDEQIRQLALLITTTTEEGDETPWELAQHFADEIDHQSALTLAESLGEDDTTVALIFEGELLPVSVDAQLRIDTELMVVTEVNSDAGTVTVERGFGTTSPAAHEAGADVFLPPVPADPPAITQPACGQLLPAAQPTAGPAEPSATLEITAQGIAWDKDQLVALPDVPLTLTVQNNDAGIPHNWVLFSSPDGPEGDRLAETPIENGVVTQTLEFGPLAVGEYYYHCDIHPQMFGTLIVQAGGGGDSGDGGDDGDGGNAGATPVPPAAPGGGETPADGGAADGA